MKQMLINAYRILVEEIPCVGGVELKENRERRMRMNKRSLQEYGVPVSKLNL